MKISKIIIILLFLIAGVFVAFYIFDTQAKNKVEWFDSSITSPEDCQEDLRQYWYNNKCWNDFSEADGSIPSEDVDSVAAFITELAGDAYLQIEGTIIKEFTPMIEIDFKGNEAVFLQVFDWKDTTYSMVTIISLKNGELEFPAQLEAELQLVRGNLLDEEVDFTKDNFISEGEGSFVGDSVATGYPNQESENISITGKLANGIEYSTYFNSLLLSMGDTTLTIEGRRAILSGTLGVKAYLQVRSLREYPEVTTLVLQNVPGSIMDEINMHTGRLIHELGLTTFVPFNSSVSSGGVDLFASGKERIIERGGELGIHSWENSEGLTAEEYPKDHPAHMFQIDYFTEIMGPDVGPDFYFRTIYAAPADDMYFMTEEEMLESQIVSKIIERGESIE